MAKFDLNGKNAIVTGGARGIGRAICESLAQRGANVILTDIDQEQGQTSANELNITYLPLDVTNRKQFNDLIDNLARDGMSIDVLVNNAGYMRIGDFTTLSEEEEGDLFNVNIRGVINGIHAVLPHMKESNTGRIVNISSLAGQVAMPYGAIYSSSKFAVTALGDALNLELKNTGINICTVFPAMVKTDLVAGISPPRFPRMITSNDVAKAVVTGICKGKYRVYVPKTGVIYSKLPSLLPQFMLNMIASLSGADKLFNQIDTEERSQYLSRIQTNANEFKNAQ